MSARITGRLIAAAMLALGVGAAAQAGPTNPPANSLQAFASGAELSDYLARIWPAETRCAGGDVPGEPPPPVVAMPDSVARGYAAIRGRVTNSPFGNPINGVTVTVERRGISVVADTLGRYSLLVPAGRAGADDSVTIEARLIGFRHVRRRVAVRARAITTLDLALCAQVISTGPNIYQAGMEPSSDAGTPGVELPDLIRRHGASS